MGATFTIGLHLEDGQLRQKLSGIRKEIEDTFTVRGSLTKDLQAATRSAKVLEQALLKATTNKGISYSVLNSELKKAGITATQLTTTLMNGGNRFRESLNAANAALALSNRQTVSLNKHLQAIGHTLKQSFKYTAAQTLWRELASQAQQSIQWVKNLNDAVNNIAVVTGKTGDQIEKVTQQAIKGSRELKVAAQEYAEGALIFYQQGLNDKEVQRRNEITIKSAKAAGQSIEDMSSQLTAIWNTYKMIGDEQLRAASVGAKMAAETAVEFKDIAEAMKSAAAPAAQMGVSYNSLASIIATVGDTTQQSASVIGNAFKTIFSRFQQLQVDGTDGEITLKKLSAQIQAMGVQVLDTTGQLLPVDKILQQIGEKWDKWTVKQQTAIAQLAGGTRQYGQFLALMDNYDKYLTNLRAAERETGATLEQQYSQAIDSIETRSRQAAEAWRRSLSNAFDVDNIKDFYSMSEKLANVVGTLVEGIAGIPGALLISAMILREKIWPTLRGAGSFIRDMISNSTTGGRQRNINATYDQRIGYFQGQIGAAQSRLQGGNLSEAEARHTRQQIANNELLIKQAENERKIALENERINTLLATANGEMRVGLELRKSALEEVLALQTATFQLLQPGTQAHNFGLISSARSSINASDLSSGKATAARRAIGGMGQLGNVAAQYATGQISAGQLGQSMLPLLMANKYWGAQPNSTKQELADLAGWAKNLGAGDVDEFLNSTYSIFERILDQNVAGDEKLATKLTEIVEVLRAQLEQSTAAIQAEQYSRTGILKEDMPYTDVGGRASYRRAAVNGLQKYNTGWMNQFRSVYGGYTGIGPGIYNFGQKNAPLAARQAAAASAQAMGGSLGRVSYTAAAIQPYERGTGYMPEGFSSRLQEIRRRQMYRGGRLQAQRQFRERISGLRSRVTQGARAELSSPGNLIGGVASSAMAGMTLDNAMDTLGDASATAAEKVSSVVGSVGSLAGAMMMIQGPIGAITLAISLVIPVIKRLMDAVSGAREREKETLSNQIETMTTSLETYDSLTDKMKDLNGESAEYKQALLDRSKALQEMLKTANLSQKEMQAVFSGGKFNRDAFESLIGSKQESLTNMNAEDWVTDAQRRQRTAQRNIQGLGFEGDLTNLPGSFSEFVQMLQEGGVDINSEEAARNMKDYYVALQQANIEVAAATDAMNQMSETAKASFLGVETLSDIEHVLEKISENGLELDYAEYSSALIQLAEQYDNCTVEIEKFKAAIYSGTTAQREQAEESLKLSVAAGELGKQWSLDAKAVEIQAREIKKANTTMELSAEEAAQLAAANQRMNRGVDTLRKNFADWKTILQSTEKNTARYAETMVSLEDTIRDLIGASADFQLPESFDPQNAHNLELLQQAADGSAEAIQRLGLEITKMSVEEMPLVSMSTDWIGRLQGNFTTANEVVANGVQAVLDNLSQLNDGSIRLGDIIDPVEFANAMNEIAAQAGWTKDQVQAQLSQMSMTADVEEEQKEFNTHVPVYLEHREPVGDMHVESYIGEDGQEVLLEKGHDWKTFTKQIGTIPVTETKSIGKITWKPGEEPIKYHSKRVAGGVNPPASTGGGGGSSGGGGGKGKEFSPKKTENTVKTGRLGERYTNIQSRIDRVTRSINQLNDAEADAWGSRTYRNLQGVNMLLAKQAEYLQVLQQEAETYLEEDQGALNELLAAQGLSASYNDQGFISNREDIINALEARRRPMAEYYDGLIKEYNDAGVANETLEKTIEEAKDALDKYKSDVVEPIMDAMEQVGETAQKVQDTLKERVDQIRQWMSNKVEMAKLKLELKLKISDTEIKQLEHLIELWGDLGTQMDRTWRNYKNLAQLATGQSRNYLENVSDMRKLLDIVNPNGAHKDEYIAAFGEQAWNQYLAGHGGHPKEVMDQLESALESAQDAMWQAQNHLRSMLEEWIKLFQFYMDKFDKIADRIAQSGAVLDMYVSLLDATGRSYTAAGANSMANISRARYSNAKTSVQLARGKYFFSQNAHNLALGRMADFQGMYGSDIGAYTQAELITYQKLQQDIDDTKAALDSALNEVTTGISNMASAMTEVLEKTGEALKVALFEDLGGFATDTSNGIDLYGMRRTADEYYLDQLDKEHGLTSLQNSILTYLEDNDISNIEAYNELLAEINEKQQEGVQINQTDLDILEKKFQLQQDIDAYEEQQKFKNTMRLARDASGNWSYVYSGDNGAADEAAMRQKILDDQYAIARAEKDALKESYEAWYQTAMKMIELNELKNSARYASDENYRRLVDQQILETEKLWDSYYQEIITREEQTDEKFSESTLAWITGTDDGITTMTDLHNQYKEYIFGFGDDVKANSKEIVTSFLEEDVPEMTEGIETLEGDYSDLEDLVDDRTSDMIDENGELADSINDLMLEGTAAMEDLTATMHDAITEMIADLNDLEQQIASLIEELQKLRREEVQQIEEAEVGFDPGTDYAAKMQNIAYRIAQEHPDWGFGQISAAAKAEIEAQQLTVQRRNKITSNEMISGGHHYAGYISPEEEANIVTAAIIAGANASGLISEIDEEGRRIAQALGIKSSAGGNYFRKPGITTIAENEPEIVLNPEDTRNILAAVRYVRMAVNNGLGQTAMAGFGITSRNASIGAMGSYGWNVQTPVQQSVQLDANFPNVNVAAEVESALDMLILQAAQYAGERQ